MIKYIPLMMMIVAVISLYIYALWPKKRSIKGEHIVLIEPMHWKKPIEVVSE